MKRPEIPGIHRVTSKGRTYEYAWRGGPRLPDPAAGVEAYIDAYRAALAARGAPRAKASATVGDLVRRYRASPDFGRLAASTQRVYGSQLAAIEAYFGDLAIAALASPRFPAEIRRWRDSRADRPRAADYGVEVLSSAFQWAVRHAHAPCNPARGIEGLHVADHADTIWQDDELAALCAAASPDAAQAITVAAYTGLRRGDLIDLRRPEIDFAAGLIDRATNKSRGRTRALPPLLDEARAVLASARGAGDYALACHYGRPWSETGLSNAFRRARDRIGVRKRFHDLRGTAATKFYLAGFDDDAVAGFMGWQLAHVRTIKRRYVGARALTASAMERMRQATE